MLASLITSLLFVVGAKAAPVVNGTLTPPPPKGGANVSASSPPPMYAPNSDFDFQSLDLALHQEWIELDLFRYALSRFSLAEFAAHGLTAEDIYLISFMGDQEVGHARLLTNILGASAAKPCTYNYTAAFNDVPTWIDYSQKLTRVGESGVLGFLPHLDSRPAAQLLLQSISTESRQQMIFRQFEGLFPMPVYFESGIPQAWAWTLLQKYLSACPANNTAVAFPIYPALTVVNNPSAINGLGAAITHNQSNISYAGMPVYLQWELPGKKAGPYNQTTVVGANVSTNASSPLFAAWTQQLNLTYTPITNISASGTSGWTIQPNGTVFSQTPNDPIINGTAFVAVTVATPFLTPFNLSLINDVMFAGPAIYQSG